MGTVLRPVAYLVDGTLEIRWLTVECVEQELVAGDLGRHPVELRVDRRHPGRHGSILWIHSWTFIHRRGFVGLFPSAGLASIRTCVLVVGKRSSGCSTRFGPASSAPGSAVRRADHPRAAGGAGALRTDTPLAARRRAPGDQPAQRTGRPTELGGKLAPALANRLRITRAEASRRIHEAADLGERSALNGEPLPAGVARHRRSPTQRRPRRRPRRGDPRLLSPAARLRRHRDPRRKPKRSWPDWPASIAPTN